MITAVVEINIVSSSSFGSSMVIIVGAERERRDMVHSI